MNAMLLEKCISGSNLNSFPESFQDETICELLKELWKADYTTENFRPLGEMVSQWNEEAYNDLEAFPRPLLA